MSAFKRKHQQFMNQNNILIIGSGVAGLACAETLIKRGKSVRLYEASNRPGGRIKPLMGFANRHLEAGGQTFHSDETEYFQLAQKVGAKLVQEEMDWEFSIYNPQTQKVMNQQDFARKHNFTAHSEIHFIDDMQLEDDSILGRIHKKGYDQNFLHFFKAFYGAEYGATIDKLSARGVGAYNHWWEYSNGDYEVQNKMQHLDILKQLFKNAFNLIEYRKKVLQVELLGSEGEGVAVFHQNQEGKEVIERFSKVVCCVPITQVKKIRWLPAFEPQRQKQLDLVGMEKGGKLFLMLDGFMKNTQSADVFVPDFGFHIIIWDNSDNKESILIALIVGDGYERCKELGVQQFSYEVVNTINQQFKEKVKLVKCHFEDWGEEANIEGLYSFPMKGADIDQRKIISEPIGDRIYFAGEAYHKREFATIHGAYEVGVLVGRKI